MERYYELSEEYEVKEGNFYRSKKRVTIELIKEAINTMTDNEQLQLANDMVALYESKNWQVNVKSMLYSIRKASRIILIKDENGLAGCFYAGKRRLLTKYSRFDFYYTEKIVLKDSISFLVMFLGIAKVIYSLPEFLHKPIITGAITRISDVRNLLCLFGREEIHSIRDWNKLIERDKLMVKGMVDASVSELFGYNYSDNMKDGILKDIFGGIISHDHNTAVIPGNNGFSDDDGTYLVNTIPAAMEQIQANFNDNVEHNKSRLSQMMMEAFITGSFQNEIKLIRG